ncbi:MAG: hypothetical protein UHD64_06725 [Bacteroidales bacterium]|nr:hypothetical protein [Bacteroidales bacterium]
MKCCKDCVPPKRHPGCHDTCEEYAKEKEEDRLKKKWANKNANPYLTNYDFNKITRYDCRYRRKRK